MAYVIAAVVALAIIGVGVAFFMGRRTGRESQRVDNLTKTVSIRDKQLVEANKPRDPQSVVDALRKGDF
jgi:uncharacterized membrane protein YvbJ